MKVTVYTTESCPYCVMLKNWLNAKGVQYEQYSVDKNPIAAQQMIQLSQQRGVPFSTVEYDDGSMEKILGFDRPRFEQALAASHAS